MMFFKNKYNVQVEPVQGPWNPVAVRRFLDKQGRAYSEICVDDIPIWLGEREQENAMVKVLRERLSDDWGAPIEEAVADLGKVIRAFILLGIRPKDVGIIEVEDSVEKIEERSKV